MMDFVAIDAFRGAYSKGGIEMDATLHIDYQSIARAADTMIRDYGSGAWPAAKQRAQDLRREGFESVAGAWDRIAEAIEEKHGMQSRIERAWIPKNSVVYWILKRLAYPILRLAHRAYITWLKLKGHRWESAAVVVWHDGKVLKVRHSYRRGWCLPGGAVRRGEDPRLAACRELREEVGLKLQPDDLTPIRDHRSGRRQYHLYECRLHERPQINTNNWEVVEARFVSPR
jgi:8-oxo-dGTP diphosphatase